MFRAEEFGVVLCLCGCSFFRGFWKVRYEVEFWDVSGRGVEVREVIFVVLF